MTSNENIIEESSSYRPGIYQKNPNDVYGNDSQDFMESPNTTTNRIPVQGYQGDRESSIQNHLYELEKNKLMMNYGIIMEENLDLKVFSLWKIVNFLGASFT